MAPEGTHDSLATAPPGWKQWWHSLRRQLRRGLPFVVGVLATLVGLYLYNLLSPPPDPLTVNDVDETIANALAEATPPPAHSVLAYETILPSLVFIQTGDVTPGTDSLIQMGAAPQSGDTIRSSDGTGIAPVVDTVQNLIQDGEEPELYGTGSGVVVNAEGAILTALHVVAHAAVIRVTFADGTQAAGTLVAAEPDNDIAVLQVDRLPEIVVPATLGNPGAMRVGDEAYVVGSPLGLAGSLSAGVISGFDRTFTPAGFAYPLTRLIQFDAAVNLGTSGGPLLNRNGEVVGIVVGLVNPIQQLDFSGIGLAVRIDEAGGAAGAPPQ